MLDWILDVKTIDLSMEYGQQYSPEYNDVRSLVDIFIIIEPRRNIRILEFQITICHYKVVKLSKQNQMSL